MIVISSQMSFIISLHQKTKNMDNSTSIELIEFFNSILAPDFIKEKFNTPFWYLLIGKFEEFLNEQIPQSQILSTSDTLKITGNVYIGNNCKISDYVVIQGPAYIGDNVEIGPHAYIRKGSIISNNCSIGHASQVKNALMMEGSKIANHSFLGDSILGVNARMGGHSETANRRFDQGQIELKFKDQKIPTQLDKYGAIIGEGSRIGGGVFTGPGTLIGKNTFVATSCSGYIPSGKFVKPGSEPDIDFNNFSGTLHS